MSIDLSVVEYVKVIARKLLDDYANMLIIKTGECRSSLNYEYYVDEVALTINPAVTYIYLYTTDIGAAIKHFVEKGLINAHNHVLYRDMLHIVITNNKVEYKKIKKENARIQIITFDNLVKWMKERNYSSSDILAFLKKTAAIKPDRTDEKSGLLSA
jgi:hypothetical protein